MNEVFSIGRNDEEGFQRSHANFEKAAESVAILVNEIQELAVPKETIEKWKILMSAMRTVDDRIDHTIDKAERAELTKKIEASLHTDTIDLADDPDLEDAMRKVRSLSNGLDDEKRRFFHRLLLSILKITEDIKQEEDIHVAVDLTMLEGQMTGKLFLPFLPNEFRESVKYQKLVYILSRFGRAANAFDNFADLPTDYVNKSVKIKPTLVNRALFLGAFLSSATSTVKKTGLSTDLLKEFLWSVKASYENGSDK